MVGTVNSTDLYGFTYANERIQTFQYPEATYTTFNGINNNGLVVGTYVNLSAGQFGVFSYSLETGTWKDLNFGDYASAIPIGVTDSGVIAAQIGPSGGLLIATPTN